MSDPVAADLAFVRRAFELTEEDFVHERGYHPSLFCQLALPYQDPGNDLPAWGRRNGTRSLVVRPGYEIDDDGEAHSIGYPYGVMPRLLLSWLATEAVRTRSPELVLGENLSDFMRQLGLSATGGKTGTITRLHAQSKRLFEASIVAKADDRENNHEARIDLSVTSAHSLWWTDNDRNAAQRTLFPSVVYLSAGFFQEVTEHPVPISIDALKALRGSSLRLDIYTWLVHRLFYLRRRTTVSWDQLRGQFGSQYAETKQGRYKFRKDFEGHLARVLLVYRDANVEVTETGLTLRASRRHIAAASPQAQLPS